MLSSQRGNCNGEISICISLFVFIYCIYLFLLPTSNAFLIWGGSSSMRIVVGGKPCYIGLEKSNARFRILNLQGMFQRHR